MVTVTEHTYNLMPEKEYCPGSGYYVGRAGTRVPCPFCQKKLAPHFKSLKLRKHKAR